MKQFLLLGSVVLAVACGSSSSSPGSISGTIHGAKFPIVDAISSTVTINGSSQGAVILSNTSGLCADLGMNGLPKNLAGAIIVVGNVSGTSATAPTAPGTFTVQAQTGASAVWNAIVTDSTCNDVTASEAKGTSGTVTLTSVGTNDYAGKFDVTLDSGDHVTGSFSPEPCPAFATAVASGMNPTCI